MGRPVVAGGIGGPRWEIDKSSDQDNLVRNQWHRVTWDTIVEEQGVSIDLANDQVTIERTGRYLVTFWWGYSDMSAHVMQAALYVGGTIHGDYTACKGDSGDAQTHNCYSNIVTLNSGDVLSAHGMHRAASNSPDIRWAYEANNRPASKWIGQWWGSA